MAGAANVPDLTGLLSTTDGGGSDYTASSSTGDQGVLSGLGDLFSSVGAAVATDYRAVQSTGVPKPVGTAGLYYDPRTGRYVNASPYAVQSGAMSPLLLLLLIGGIAYILLRK